MNGFRSARQFPETTCQDVDSRHVAQVVQPAGSPLGSGQSAWPAPAGALRAWSSAISGRPREPMEALISFWSLSGGAPASSQDCRRTHLDTLTAMTIALGCLAVMD